MSHCGKLGRSLRRERPQHALLRWGVSKGREEDGRTRRGFSGRISGGPPNCFGNRTPDVGGLSGLAGVAGEIIAAECGGDVRLDPSLSDGGDAEGHICGGWPALVGGRQAEAGECNGRGAPADRTCCEAETQGGAFGFCLLLEREQSGAESLGLGERVTGCGVETSERVQALRVAMLELTVGETGGRVRTCANLLLLDLRRTARLASSQRGFLVLWKVAACDGAMPGSCRGLSQPRRRVRTRLTKPYSSSSEFCRGVAVRSTLCRSVNAFLIALPILLPGL